MESRDSKRFLLISIIPRSLSDVDALSDLREVKALIESYGGSLKELITQRREIHDKGSFIGDGKMRESLMMIKKARIDIVVLNGVIKPGQIHEMKSYFRKSNRAIEVWDRVDLILQIFAKHAHTKEASLQIELAAIRHMGPRIYGMGMEMSRQRGGIGARGVGETNTELMKRHWHVRMKVVKDKLKKLTTERKRQLSHRKRVGMHTASLVGYTNAGKTSLFNVLTKKEKEVENALFVTLDSSVGKIFLQSSGKNILVSDTIGFIKNLPTQLIDAFKSTLLESIHADVLLHIIDASDKDMSSKIAVVENILKSLSLENRKTIYVFNKIDKVKDIDKKEILESYRDLPVHFVSVKNNQGIEELIASIEHEIGLESLNKKEELLQIEL